MKKVSTVKSIKSIVCALPKCYIKAEKDSAFCKYHGGNEYRSKKWDS